VKSSRQQGGSVSHQSLHDPR